VPDRRLEDKIRHLCALATAANDEDAWLLLSELRLLITQQIEHLRIAAAANLSGAADFVERRSVTNSHQNQSFAEAPERAEFREDILPPEK
jgi:hypothetical protein